MGSYVYVKSRWRSHSVQMNNPIMKKKTKDSCPRTSERSSGKSVKLAN
jgi:hypothetical protein